MPPDGEGEGERQHPRVDLDGFEALSSRPHSARFLSADTTPSVTSSSVQLFLCQPYEHKLLLTALSNC